LALHPPSSACTFAVMPFARTASAEPSELADGLHEEVVAAPGQIDPERLRVLARLSTMAYALPGRSAGQIGRALGADYLVEGVSHEQGANWRFTFTVVNVRDE